MASLFAAKADWKKDFKVCFEDFIVGITTIVEVIGHSPFVTLKIVYDCLALIYYDWGNNI